MLSQLGRTQLSPTFLGGWMSGIDGFSKSSGLFRFPCARTCREKGWVFLVPRGPLSSHLSRDWSLECGGPMIPFVNCRSFMRRGYQEAQDQQFMRGSWKMEDGRWTTVEFSCREQHANPQKWQDPEK